MTASPLWALAGRRWSLPPAELPEGRMVDLRGRGATYVTDTPGPTPDSPTLVLLHALACTGLLTWYPSIAPLSSRFRVVTLDLRWHGRGIQGNAFSLHDCADDVAALLDVLEVDAAVVAGYSMGSVVAQRVWRQHPDRTAGLVLCATTDRFRGTPAEVLFHAATEATMLGVRGLSRSRTAAHAARSAARSVDPAGAGIDAWAVAQLRSTSPWAVGQAVAALGRHHSRPWLPRVDVPTAVVVTRHDKVVPPSRQLALARLVPGATVHDIPAGHAACLLQTDTFVPAVVQAAATVQARRARSGR